MFFPNHIIRYLYHPDLFLLNSYLLAFSAIKHTKKTLRFVQDKTKTRRMLGVFPRLVKPLMASG